MGEPNVDFGDPSSIRAAIPQVAQLVQEAEQEMDDAALAVSSASERHRKAEAKLRRWRGLADALRGMADLPDGMGAAEALAADEIDLDDLPEDPDSKRLALRIVTLINGPASISDVAEYMPEASHKTVSWALWKLAKEGTVQRLSHGAYAPLGYKPGQRTTNYFEAAKAGFPTPSPRQIDDAVEGAIERALERFPPDVEGP